MSRKSVKVIFYSFLPFPVYNLFFFFLNVGVEHSEFFKKISKMKFDESASLLLPRKMDVTLKITIIMNSKVSLA